MTSGITYKVTQLSDVYTENIWIYRSMCFLFVIEKHCMHS